MKPFYIIIIFCAVLGFSDISIALGGDFRMHTVNKGIWKGIVPVTFKGRISDFQTNEAVKTFSVCEIVNGVPHKGQLESDGKIIDMGPQTIETKNGDYNFTLYIATLNGQTYVNNSKHCRVLGIASEAITLQTTVVGYENKNIVIAKDKILVGEDNYLDIVLNPIPKDK